MLRADVEERLRDEHELDGYLRPDYDGYCSGSVPDTVRSLLDAGGCRPLPGDVFEGVDTRLERVVVVLVDGYGLDSWRRDSARSTPGWPTPASTATCDRDGPGGTARESGGRPRGGVGARTNRDRQAGVRTAGSSGGPSEGPPTAATAG